MSANDRPSAQKPGRRVWAAGAVLGALAAALILNQVMAGQLGRWLAGVWLGSIEVVLRLLAPLLGG